MSPGDFFVRSKSIGIVIRDYGNDDLFGLGILAGAG